MHNVVILQILFASIVRDINFHTKYRRVYVLTEYVLRAIFW